MTQANRPPAKPGRFNWPGFQRLVAEVGLGRVGLVLGVEMSRLARSCRDWHQLLEICALSDTLIADVDGVYARDEDGDGFCEIHVNTMEGTWSLLRSWLRPHRGISQEKLPLYLGFFQLVHNARRRGKALLGTLIAGLVAKTDARHPETR